MFTILMAIHQINVRLLDNDNEQISNIITINSKGYFRFINVSTYNVIIKFQDTRKPKKYVTANRIFDLELLSTIKIFS